MYNNKNCNNCYHTIMNKKLVIKYIYLSIIVHIYLRAITKRTITSEARKEARCMYGTVGECQ